MYTDTQARAEARYRIERAAARAESRRWLRMTRRAHGAPRTTPTLAVSGALPVSPDPTIPAAREPRPVAASTIDGDGRVSAHMAA